MPLEHRNYSKFMKNNPSEDEFTIKYCKPRNE